MSINPEKIEEILHSYNGESVPGYALAILYNNEIISYVHGYADLENKVLVSPLTNFRLCSVSKQCTAAAILLLQERDKLAFVDSLEKYFPEFPEYGKKITIHQLLTHTSGLIDYEDVLESKEQIHDDGVLELLTKQRNGYFEPGAEYRYSNGGYCLLRLIAEKVSQQDFSEFMKENIFQPLGMSTTCVNKEGSTVIPNRAYGYSRTKDGWTRTDQDATSATIGDGGIYSSITDMCTWSDSLSSAAFLSKESLAMMFSKQVATNEPGVFYGYGYFLKKHKGTLIQYHGGDSIGFRTGIYRAPEKGISIIFLSNRNEGIGSKICEELFDAVDES